MECLLKILTTHFGETLTRQTTHNDIKHHTPPHLQRISRTASSNTRMNVTPPLPPPFPFPKALGWGCRQATCIALESKSSGCTTHFSARQRRQLDHHPFAASRKVREPRNPATASRHLPTILFFFPFPPVICKERAAEPENLKKRISLPPAPAPAPLGKPRAGVAHTSQQQIPD